MGPTATQWQFMLGVVMFCAVITVLRAVLPRVPVHDRLYLGLVYVAAARLLQTKAWIMIIFVTSCRRHANGAGG